MPHSSRSELDEWQVVASIHLPSEGIASLMGFLGGGLKHHVLNADRRIAVELQNEKEGEAGATGDSCWD